jgi:hypothetical protein
MGLTAGGLWKQEPRFSKTAQAPRPITALMKTRPRKKISGVRWVP